jgi:hypothetical protein
VIADVAETNVLVLTARQDETAHRDRAGWIEFSKLQSPSISEWINLNSLANPSLR